MTPSPRHANQRELTVANIYLTAVQWVVLALLFLLACYSAWLADPDKWDQLAGLLAPATAACAALLVATTANRLLLYNMLVRADDRGLDIVRVTHRTIAVLTICAAGSTTCI
jgi:hypothetical protein